MFVQVTYTIISCFLVLVMAMLWDTSINEKIPLLCTYSPLIKYIPTTASRPSTPLRYPAQLPIFPRIITSRFPFLHFQEKSAFLLVWTEHSITRFHKTRHKPLYYGWMKQYRRIKRVLRAARRVRDIPMPTVSSPKLNNIHIMGMFMCSLILCTFCYATIKQNKLLQ